MAKRTDELTAHPVAALFPMLPDDELQELAESIKARGLEHPIVLDKDGLILDGRNRYAACKLAGIEPRFVQFEGEDADGYALDTNIHRRHLRPGARNLVTEMARRKRNDASVGKSQQSQRGLAKEAGIQFSELSTAAAVLDYAPDLVPDVLAGRMGLQAAADVAREKKRAQKEREAKSARLKEGAADLFELVEDGRFQLDDAIAALEARERKAKDEEAARKAKENAELQKRSVELKNAIDDAANASRDFASAFVADALTIIGGQQAIPQAIEIFGEKIVPAPLFTRDRLAEIEKALALLKKEFAL